MKCEGSGLSPASMSGNGFEYDLIVNIIIVYDSPARVSGNGFEMKIVVGVCGSGGAVFCCVILS